VNDRPDVHHVGMSKGMSNIDYVFMIIIGLGGVAAVCSMLALVLLLLILT
jgi:hypothetical protein